MVGRNLSNAAMRVPRKVVDQAEGLKGAEIFSVVLIGRINRHVPRGVT